MSMLNTESLLTVERDVSLDGKVHLVIMNGQPRDETNPSSVLYITKLDHGTRSHCEGNDECKEEWPSSSMDVGLLYGDHDSELLPRFSMGEREGEKYQRAAYPSDEFGEEKVTCSPDPPTVNSAETQNSNPSDGCSIDHLKQAEVNTDLSTPPLSANMHPSRDRWTDPPKVVVKSQSIDIHYPDRPRVYSAISSLEESFQIKNNYLVNNGPSKLQRNFSPSNAHSSLSHFLDDATRGHSRSQTALADEIIYHEPLKTESQGVQSGMDPNHQNTGILKGTMKLKQGENQTKKIAFDTNESMIQSSEHPPMEMFRPSCDAYTPRMGHKAIKYKSAAERRLSVDKVSTTMGSIQRPNFRDALRRVAMIIHQHIVKIEKRFELKPHSVHEVGLFSQEMRSIFTEENFLTPRFVVTVLNFPAARSGFQFGKRRIKTSHKIPTVEEIYDFAHQLFNTVQLSSECSIVCLIYVERLMEIAKVPLMSDTWRPIVMCGLLLASKVWQDLSSWNIEFASVYPQYSLSAINRIESQFLKMVKWDLYISSSLYAKYYFALRSLLEKRDFRQKYIRLTAVEQLAASEAIKVQERTSVVKDGFISELSRSM